MALLQCVDIRPVYCWGLFFFVTTHECNTGHVCGLLHCMYNFLSLSDLLAVCGSSYYRYYIVYALAKFSLFQCLTLLLN